MSNTTTPLTTAAPEAAITQNALPEDPHPGQAMYETNGAVALPGEDVQIYVKFVGDAVLHGVIIDEGGALQKVIAGNQQIVATASGFKFGQKLTNGAYCIAIVKNVSDETKTLKGAFLASVTINGASPQGGSLTSPHTVANAMNQPMAGGHGASVSPRAPSGGSATVTPGMNEIAVLLPYGEAKRLLDVVNGSGMPISDSERAGIARAFHHGFQRSGMG